MEKKPLRIYLFIALTLQLVWGIVPSASQKVIQEIPVELFIALRWTVSGLIFLSFLKVSGRWTNIKTKEAFPIALLGIGGFGIASFCTLYGLKVGGVANFALMSAVGPIISSTLSILILKEKPARLFWLALPLSVTGLLLLSAGKLQVSNFKIALTSALFILGGAFLEALVFVFSRKYKTRVSSFQYLAIAQLSTAALMWTLQFSVFHQLHAVLNLSVTGLLAFGFVCIVACVLCYGILYWLLNHIEGHKLALFDAFHALSGTVCGILIFHEPLHLLMFVGGFLILTAITIGNISPTPDAC